MSDEGQPSEGQQSEGQQSEGTASSAVTGASDARVKQLRWAAYWLMIALAVGNMAGRILAVNSVDLARVESARLAKALQQQRQKLVAQNFQGAVLEEKLARYENIVRKRLQLQRPFLSANDRSRWCTIRALIDHRTYAITEIVTDEYEYDRWNTIDMVKHDRVGRPDLYSSKPTLLPTMLASLYWVVQKVSGWTLADQPYQVVRTMLLLVNVPCMIVIFLLLARMVERVGETDWGRLLVMAAATFATFLTTFAVVLNNHLIGAVSSMVTLYSVAMIWYGGRREWWWFALTGLFAALTAAIELPALSFLGLLGLGLLWKAPRPTLAYGLPAVLVIAAAALGTNYAAHRTVLPAYWYRTPGQDWQTGNWYNYDYQVGSRTKYSYWKQEEEFRRARSIVDQGEESKLHYAMQCLIGHHGIFSLTPIWLFSLAGVVAMLFHGKPPKYRSAGILIAVVTLTCFSFYMTRATESRNYGGMSSGLRWMFWFTPMWLLAMIPAADWSARRRPRRMLAAILLAFSVLSASYPTWNPWTHPWISRWMAHLEWIEL